MAAQHKACNVVQCLASKLRKKVPQSVSAVETEHDADVPLPQSKSPQAALLHLKWLACT
jgi:hypothetical protein